MRTFVLAIAAAMAATTAQAVDLTPSLALNTEVVAEYKYDAESTTLTATPELEFAPTYLPGAAFTAGMELNIWDNTNKFTLDNEFDVKPEILLGATFAPATMPNMELELGSSYDFEAKERGEITATATFNF